MENENDLIILYDEAFELLELLAGENNEEQLNMFGFGIAPQSPLAYIHITPIARQLLRLLINFRAQFENEPQFINTSLGSLQPFFYSSAHDLTWPSSLSLQIRTPVWLKAPVSTVPPSHLVPWFASGSARTGY